MINFWFIALVWKDLTATIFAKDQEDITFLSDNCKAENVLT